MLGFCIAWRLGGFMRSGVECVARMSLHSIRSGCDQTKSKEWNGCKNPESIRRDAAGRDTNWLALYSA